MPTYYVNTATGNDTNDGTAATTGGGHGPWQTFGKPLIAGSGVVGGDVVYIAPGVYRQSGITVGITPASELQIIADVTGTHTGTSPGEVRVTGYTTNDTTAPALSTILTLNGKSHLTFQDIVFVGGATGYSAVDGASTNNSQYITLRRCVFLWAYAATGSLITATNNVSTPFHWLLDGCRFWSFNGNHAVLFTIASNDGSQHNMDALVQNSVFIGSSVAANQAFIRLDTGGDWGGGGLSVLNNLFIGAKLGVYQGDFGSTTYPTLIYGNILFQGYGQTALYAVFAGAYQIEDYNIFCCPTPRGNSNGSWNVGAHSVSDNSRAPLFSFGQELLWSSIARPLGMPLASSPYSGFDAQAGGPATDMLGTTRPSPAAVGPLEYTAPTGGGGGQHASGFAQ